jgi:hypothetical protein
VNRGEFLEGHRDIEVIENSESAEITTSGIAIRDIPIGAGPSIVEDTCQEIPGVGDRRIGVSKHKEILSYEIVIRDLPTRSEPSIGWNTCQQIPKSRSSGHRSFRR